MRLLRLETAGKTGRRPRRAKPGGAAPAVRGGQPHAAGLHAAPAGDLWRIVGGGRGDAGLNVQLRLAYLGSKERKRCLDD